MIYLKVNTIIIKVFYTKAIRFYQNQPKNKLGFNNKNKQVLGNHVLKL